ncbi:type VI secretion system tip protein TssI/VgrG [Achromobacter seleniivolatilans]|uniref:Type VI secretion system tip protein TssI/VgrG n=1 Tax=Achromobacter seleniivolatilans TaxID=3047478 RepID=A0ABY9LXI1_9BURK|nr:type VI secretion system Vgr family protein [Achromobacter sp. R39]WMD19180.1 type VI secretion system tip protein TssI/VgrG [Achromobacter sp. R39]
MPQRQSDLRFTFEPICGAAFDVIEFTLEEALSESYRLCVELSSFDPAVDFGALLDQPALFTVWRGSQAVRYVHGIVSAFEQADTGFRRTRYRVVVEPSLARAALCSDWRIFQHLSVPEIMADVVKRQGITDYEQVTTREHLTREYCVQAGDTDLQFLDRLAAEEGYFYRYEHSAKSHRLIHGDRIYVHGEISGGPVVYNPMPGGDQPEPALYRFTYAERVRTAIQTQRDYTYTHPQYAQEHSPIAGGLDHQDSRYERYDYPGRYKRDEAGKPYTQSRLLGHRRDARVASVEGDDARLVPGVAFDLTGHLREEWNQGWRPVRMRHHGVQHTSQEEDGAGAGLGTHYRYTAEIVPDKVDWKPEPCPKPRIDGPQVATVVGPPDEEIFCDSWGRVKVQFPWDRLGRQDEHSSCWIRVSQNWAGALWGHMAVPRIGQEVIVSFLDGDCDQPVITGRTYRATNLPPYALPRHNILNTIKSKEHKGNRANELRLDDTSEQISAALMSEHGATELHLGYLTHPRPGGGAPRGEGFELRTDEHGVLRAAKGLLLTTEAQLRAKGGQLDRSEITGVLEAALALARNLGEYAAVHEGVAHDAQPQHALTEAVRDLGHGANDQPDGRGQGDRAAMAFSAPAGIAVGTPASLALAAGEHIDSIATQHQQISAGEKIVVNAGGDLGLFSQGGDVRHIAHQGEMLLQAQHNHIRIQADQSAEITSSKQHVLIGADKHITLLCGGAYIKMAGGNIELGMPGTFTVKASTHEFSGPAGRGATLPVFKSPDAVTGDYAGKFRLRKTDERDFEGYRYRIMAGGTLLVEGLTDQAGETEFIETSNARSVQTYKTIMREDQRITGSPDALVGELDSTNPQFPEPGPHDEEFLDQHMEGGG